MGWFSPGYVLAHPSVVIRQEGRIIAFEEKPRPERLQEIGRSMPAGAPFARHDDSHPFMASMGVYVFSREVMHEILER